MKMPTITNKIKVMSVLCGVLIMAPITYAMNQSPQDPQMVSSLSTHERTISVEVEFIPIEKVRKGVVESVDPENVYFVIQVGKQIVSIKNNASTTFYFGSGDIADVHDVSDGMKVYVFGNISTDNSTMSASKVVIANKSIRSRE